MLLPGVQLGCVIHSLECNTEINMNTMKDILHILQAMIEQNYFQFDLECYRETSGLVMGAPTSLLAEIYIQTTWNVKKCTQSKKTTHNHLFQLC